MKQNFISYTLISLSISILGLSACGTNDPSNLQQPSNGQKNATNDASKSNNSTNSEVDTNVQMVSQDEFEKIKQSPSFVLLDEGQVKKTEEQEKMTLDDNQKTVDEFIKSNPEESEMLLKEPSPDDKNIEFLDDGNYLLKVKNSIGEEQKVTTLGKRFKIDSAASAIKNFPTFENQVDIYKGVFDSLPEDEKEPIESKMYLKASATPKTYTTPSYNQGVLDSASPGVIASEKILFPRPQRLEKMPLNDIKQYNVKISQRLYDIARIKFYDMNTPEGYVSNPANEEGAGNGNDRTNSSNTSCTTPKANGIYKNSNWTNKYFVTSVKNQGSRGTCVAFAIASADEMKIAKKNSKWVNLSEQDYYYKNKAVWWPSTYGDGLDTLLTWKKLKTTGYRMPYENDWNYNPSYSRVNNKVAHTYTNSCNGYGEECSDTNHQGKKVCVDLPTGRVCGTMSGSTSSNPYVLPGGIQELWNFSNKNLSISLTAINLAIGNPVVISTDIPPSFDTVDANGYVHYTSSSETSRGGHALHVSGFISNDVLTKKIPSAPAGAGGGYFIVKNSWGPCFADAGYIYLPFDWVKKYAYSMTVRN